VEDKLVFNTIFFFVGQTGRWKSVEQAYGAR
jgi:hypothetical protein